ncbi:hypothetical protein [Plasticicumulans sp.]|uniref:hypothetical protein n=1 Tax=Plasticicumulans sp. TaxID=2307179 RepID=UPI0032208B70
MLKICLPESGYPWPVSVTRPHLERAGEHETQLFTARFRFLSQARIEEIGADLRSTAPTLTDEGLVREVLIGWSDVLGVDDEPAPFSDATRDALTGLPGVRKAIVHAWFESMREGPAGN